MSLKLATIQSNYIPWKGYFDIINLADVFVLHDDVQYTKKDWRNRNKIKTPEGVQWLTVPCGTDLKRLICEVKLKNSTWQQRHWNRILTNYSKAEFFQDYKSFFEFVYLKSKWLSLSELNHFLIKSICSEILDIETKIEDSRIFTLTGRKQERIINLMKKVGADTYISGPSARAYIDEKAFHEAGFDLIWMDYSGYPCYCQLFPPFRHDVSIIDLIFNEGPNATQYMKSFQNDTKKLQGSSP